MKISLSWLKQWTNYPSNEATLAEQLSLSGLETTVLPSELDPFTGVIVGEIITVKPHPNANHLSLCTVDCGKANTKTIVCGALNVRQGLKVATALPGAQLPSGLIIQAETIHGVTSQGLLCSLSELRLETLFTQEATTAGIWELSVDLPLGTDLWGHLALGDLILDVQIPPNRGDCLSTVGLAREVSVLNQLNCKNPTSNEVAVAIKDTISLYIDQPMACPSYTGRAIRHLNAKTKTPWWIITRLHQGGIRSINAIVDILNYSLLEWGAPLHAFDLDQLSGPLCVRLAYSHEKIQLLNGKTVTLENDTLVIADQKTPIAIAGIMGSLPSGVTSKTVNIFLESAFFMPAAIAGKARKYGLTTESSYRFERGVDPLLPRQALERVTHLLLAICGGQAGPVVMIEKTDYLPDAKSINLEQAQISKVLGIDLPATTIAAHLKRIGMQILSSTTHEMGLWKLKSPSWRFDITKAVDLIEEIARLFGYDNIPGNLPAYPLSFEPSPPERDNLASLKTFLASQGYYEVINYSFCSSHHQKLLDPNRPPILLTNPISSELNVLRTQLWPGLIRNLQHNQYYYQDSYRFFESGTVFIKDESSITERLQIGGLITGTRLPKQWGAPQQAIDFFDIKQTVNNSLQQLDPRGHYTYHTSEHPALHPSQSSQLCRNGQVIGWMGALHPKLYEYFDLTGPIYLFEWQLQGIRASHTPRFTALARFPSIKRDIAFWVSKEISFDSIKAVIFDKGGEYLKDLRLFDVYQTKDHPTQRSLALSLVWQASTKTLTDREVDTLQTRVIQKLEREFSIAVR